MANGALFLNSCIGALLLGQLAGSTVLYDAIAVFRTGTGSGGVSGLVRFRNGPNCTVTVAGSLLGLRPNASYGFRVHEAGDIRAGCSNTGALWNPPGGSSATAVQAGDLGTVRSDGLGIAKIDASRLTISSVGLAELYGRSIVLHNLTDGVGQGSIATSSFSAGAGAPVACAVIGKSADAVASNDCPAWNATDIVADNLSDAGIATFVGDSSGINGSVQFRLLANCSIQVLGFVGGLRPSSLQASHVHAIGDLSGPCNYTGSHLNPTNATHGSGVTLASHAGDLGNLLADGAGTASIDLVNPVMSQLSLRSLYGLSVVIHNLTDDLGLGGTPASLSNGNAGPRVACAVVGRALQTDAVAGKSGTACRRSSPMQDTATTPNPMSSGLQCRGSTSRYLAIAAAQALLMFMLRE